VSYRKIAPSTIWTATVPDFELTEIAITDASMATRDLEIRPERNLKFRQWQDKTRNLCIFCRTSAALQVWICHDKGIK